MKRLVPLALLIATAACTAGTNVGAPDLSNALRGLPTEVVLGFGEEIQVDGGVLRLSFAEVLEDSRCPTDVTCVWEGNGKVRIGIAMGMGPTHPLDLNSTVDPRSADRNGVRVTLLEITPAPISTQPIPLEDYAVRLLVEEVP